MRPFFWLNLQTSRKSKPEKPEAVYVFPEKRKNSESEVAHLAVRFAQDHVCIDNFQNMCGELIHILQRHDLKGYKAFFVLIK